jgi:hypothetical protein
MAKHDTKEKGYHPAALFTEYQVITSLGPVYPECGQTNPANGNGSSDPA